MPSSYEALRCLIFPVTLTLSGGLGGCSESAPAAAPQLSAGTGGMAGAGASGGGASAGGAAGTATLAGSAGQASGGTLTGGSGGDAMSGGSAGTAGSGGGGGVAGGSAGAGGSGGANACANALYCDDFDAYTVANNPGGNWKTSIQYSGNSNGMVSVDSAHAYSGSNSVHFKTPGNTDFEHAFITLEGSPYFPVKDNVFYGRMMVYVTQLPGNTVHWTLIQGQGTMVPGFPNLTEAVYRYGGQINGDQLMANYDTKPMSSDCAQRSTTKMPKSQWTCVEWRFDGKLKELDFWMDGTQNQALSVRQKANNTGVCQNKAWSGTWEPPTFNQIGIGFQHYQKGAGEVWIDDFAISTERVGCPAASATAK